MDDMIVKMSPSRTIKGKFCTNESCQSCLQQHDKEIREALEKLMFDFTHVHKRQRLLYRKDTPIKAYRNWNNFWKERGI